MRIVAMTCPSCGAQMNVPMGQGTNGQTQIRCSFCGAQLYVDDEVQRIEQHVKYDNAEDAGYSFEKGRQRAQFEANQGFNNQQMGWGSSQQAMGWQQAPQVVEQKKKMGIGKILLWGLGWLCIFPVPLTILMLRKKNMPTKQRNGIIIGAWVAYLILVAVSNIVNPHDESSDTTVNEVPTQTTSDVEQNAQEADTSELPSDTPAIATEESQTIRLEGGVMSEYGEVKINNQGTDLEEERIIFRIPAGIYEVKCIPRPVAINRIQVHIYSFEEIQDGDSPYRIPADKRNIDLEGEQTAEVEIPDGYYVWLNDNDIIELTRKQDAVAPAEQAETETILLEGGVVGQYGVAKIINQGTDLEQERIIFNIPAGLYEVKSLTEPWAQVNVYSYEEVQQEGGMEPADSRVEMIKFGETAEVEVPDGYYIYITQPDKIELIRK